MCQGCHAYPLRTDSIKAAFVLEGPVREMIYGLKYRNVRASAPQMARLLAEKEASALAAADVLVPVPLHPRRERYRGYNQSALLASALADLAGTASEPALLSRSRNTPPQVDLTGHERRRNIADAFTSTPAVAGRKVLLVDDVVTTGASMSACAAALKAAGASSVRGLAFARQTETGGD